MSYAFRWNNYKHPNLVAAFDFGTLTDDKTKIKNLSLRGSAYDATINGVYVPALPLIRAKRTPCMDFGGVNEYLSLLNPLKSLTNFSLIYWANPTDFNKVQFCSALAGSEWFQVMDGSGYSALRAGSVGPWGGDPPRAAHNKLYPGNTYMMAFVKDSSAQGIIYFNSKVYMVGVTGATSATVNAFIGQYFSGIAREYGKLDNMLFYNIALTPDQIQSIWRSANPR